VPPTLGLRGAVDDHRLSSSHGRNCVSASAVTWRPTGRYYTGIPVISVAVLADTESSCTKSAKPSRASPAWSPGSLSVGSSTSRHP